MARPAISASITSKHLTESEKQAKIEAEQNLKGNTDKITPPDYLNQNQRKIFMYIVNELSNSDILGNLDIYVLSDCAVAIDRIQMIESQINSDIELMLNSALMASKEKYNRVFFRCCNELCLSPQSRAKIGNLNAKEESNPLIEVLKND